MDSSLTTPSPLYIYINRPLVPLLIEPRRVNSVVSLQMIYLARKNATSFCRRRWRRLCMTFRTCRPPPSSIQPLPHTQNQFITKILWCLLCAPGLITTSPQPSPTPTEICVSFLQCHHSISKPEFLLHSNQILVLMSFTLHFGTTSWAFHWLVSLIVVVSIGGYPSGYLFSPELWCAYVVNLKRSIFYDYKL